MWEVDFVLFNSMLKYVINRLMHAFFHFRTVIIPRPILTLGLKPSGRYRSLGMITVLIWKRACINLWLSARLDYSCETGWNKHDSSYYSKQNSIYIYIWCGFKSRRGKNKNLTALKSNSNTVWFNFQTYKYFFIQKLPLYNGCKHQRDTNDCV